MRDFPEACAADVAVDLRRAWQSRCRLESGRRCWCVRPADEAAEAEARQVIWRGYRVCSSPLPVCVGRQRAPCPKRRRGWPGRVDVDGQSGLDLAVGSVTAARSDRRPVTAIGSRSRRRRGLWVTAAARQGRKATPSRCTVWILVDCLKYQGLCHAQRGPERSLLLLSPFVRLSAP